jgi:hypothetical protein
MDTFRGIPNKYLAIACLALSFLLFSAGGTVFDQNLFYAVLFFVTALLLFFVGMHFGRQDPGTE